MILSLLLLALPLVQTDTLDNVVVTGTRVSTDIRHLPMTVTVVDREALTENMRPNILPTLEEQVPGLFVTARSMMGYGVSDGGSGMMTLRGISSNTGGLMMLIDGHPQYQGLFGHSVADMYQTLMAERVEVLRGPSSVLYGSNAMGGVVNIVTRQMHEDGQQTDLSLGAGSYGTVQAEATNRVRKGRFYSVVAMQYGRSDNHRPDMGFYQYGGMAKLGYEFSSHWETRADFDLTHFAASYPGSVSDPILDARQWVNRGTAELAIENHYRKTSGAVSAYYNFGRHKINDGHALGEEPKTYYFRSNDALSGLSLWQSATLFSGNRITAGFDWQHIYGHAWNRSMQTGETTYTAGNDKEDEVAGYIDFRQDIVGWLTLDAGVRIDHHSQTGTECVPQGGLVFRLTDGGALKAMVSKGFRNPSIKEMYLWGPANEELLPERMVTYELSWKHRLRSVPFSYGINVFYINGDNMIETQMVDGKPMNVNTGEVENCGAELEWQWEATKHWRLNSNYSYLHMKNKVIAAPEFKGYLGANYTLGHFSLSGGLQYVTGLYTQVSETEGDVKEHFWLLNATLSYQVCKQTAIWAKGDNLLAQRYEINHGYPMPRATFMGGVRVSL
ncbi:MAG: TonB-dependent receptor [Prevotellaceae bacterium]|nr:TonB-dependent receptor [Prevotellaceae bacterium]